MTSVFGMFSARDGIRAIGYGAAPFVPGSPAAPAPCGAAGQSPETSQDRKDPLVRPTLSANPLDLSRGDVVLVHPTRHGLEGWWTVTGKPVFTGRTVEVPVAAEGGGSDTFSVPVGCEVTILGAVPEKERVPSPAPSTVPDEE